ncbi:MAG: ABC transporter substrate-binding protein [Candidatus Margulisiibacteriota bacterium]
MRVTILCAFLCFTTGITNAATDNAVPADTGATTTNIIACDGLWFLGFNLHKDLFSDDNGLKVRQAIKYAIHREKIVKEIVENSHVPDGVIPPGMEGFTEPGPIIFDLKLAKQLMQEAGYEITDKRIKNISLLHTNGVLTRAIVEELQENLKHIGIKLHPKGIDYADQEAWANALKSGQHHLFLMGFKAEAPDDVLTFLEPMFQSTGYVNFMFLNDSRIDKLLQETSFSANKYIRLKKIQQIQSFIQEQIPVIGLFYIQRM